MTLAAVGDVERALAREHYLADRPLALAVFLAATLEQPLLLEGEAGVGKTEVAKALAVGTGARLIRLQCHEGIDLHHALYDWTTRASCSRCGRPRPGRRATTSCSRGGSCCGGRCSRRSKRPRTSSC